jgi:hypothetical protein
MESPEKAGRETKKKELTFGIMISLDKILKSQAEISTVN